MRSKDTIDQDTRLALVLFRYSTFLDQGDFAKAARIAASQLSGYERGAASVPLNVLERAADAAGFPRVLLQPLLRAIRSYRLAARGWSRTRGLRTDSLFFGFLELAGEIVDLVGPSNAERQPVRPSVSDRAVAQELWLRLQDCTPQQRWLIVEEAEEFHTWAFVERVAAESIEVAPKSPSGALELAELAVRIAELCPGEDWLRSLAESYAWFHVSNAYRTASQMEEADAALAAAKKLWTTSTADGLFSEAIVLALEATLHIDRRRFPLALERIEEALRLDAPEIRGRLLLTKAQALEAIGDVEASTEALREALCYLDEQREPRIALGLRYQLLTNLCLVNRASEAAVGLSGVRALAEELGQELDLVRVVWLSGAVAAGCHQVEEAEAAFEQARQQFSSFDPPFAFDYALVSLDLAVLLLEQNRTSEVIPLAEQAVNLFQSYGIQREALAALQVYCEAARREAATVELTRQVIRFLHRAQHDPELRFAA